MKPNYWIKENKFLHIHLWVCMHQEGCMSTHIIAFLYSQVRTCSIAHFVWRCVCDRERVYRENEVVPHFKNRSQEINTSPHHPQVVRSHKVCLSRKINSFSDKNKAMDMQNQTTSICLLVQGNNYQMIQKFTGVISNPKALNEEINDWIWSCPCFI